MQSDDAFNNPHYVHNAGLHPIYASKFMQIDKCLLVKTQKAHLPKRNLECSHTDHDRSHYTLSSLALSLALVHHTVFPSS